MKKRKDGAEEQRREAKERGKRRTKVHCNLMLSNSRDYTKRSQPLNPTGKVPNIPGNTKFRLACGNLSPYIPPLSPHSYPFLLPLILSSPSSSP